MPRLKKIVVIGGAKGVILPKSFLDFQEKKYGQPIKEVTLSETSHGLLIVPVAPAPKTAEASPTLLEGQPE